MLSPFFLTIDGQGRNRTADTLIFSQVLYQLSYLASTSSYPVKGASIGRL
jgi:hypothetical protein